MSIEFLNNLHWFWFALTVIFALIEIFTMGLTTIWFAIGSLIMIFLSFTGMPFLYQVFTCAVISTLLLIFTRPIVVKKLKIGKEKTNTDSLIGKMCLVTKKITPLEKGEVKINGVFWSASTDEGLTVKEGKECIIAKVEGATLYVIPSQDSHKKTTEEA